LNENYSEKILIVSLLTLLIKYIFFYIFIYLSGKSLFIIYEFVTKLKAPEKILFTNKTTLYPVIGLFTIGNLLIIFNFIIPLENIFIYVLLFCFNIPAILKSNIKLKINLRNLIKYLVLPTILVISTYDTSFNYDAGYYHIYHQAWLRESNLILGFVNIFWPLGMSSIYEYISSILWFDTSFVLLHFLNLIFIHFFYNFIFENIVNNEFRDLKVASIFLLIYSFIDNFGIGGGRNGFIYIQGVGKQDVAVGILFFYISIVLIKAIKDRNFSNIDMFFVSLLILFLYEIKLSSVIIVLIYLWYLASTYISGTYDFKSIVLSNTFAISIFLIWTLKSFLTTSCLIFPVAVTCFENISWYVAGSTEAYEGITKLASSSYDLSVSFIQWVRETGSFEYRRQVFLNFVISFLFFVIFKIIFFRDKKLNTHNKKIIFICLAFIFINIAYLLFYGPIPRYAVGLCLLIISLIGFFSKDIFKKSSVLITSLFVILSIFFVVRSVSYIAFFNNDDFRLFDPRTNNEIYIDIGFSQFNDNWVIPSDGDQCWANIGCSMAKADILINDGFFKTAYRITNSS
tara:strand:+ start:221 stop:1930 length:1710 start_codon:yes stop_codon:yes gene_type:complete